MFGKSEEGIDKKLARNIKRIRMERGMTQKTLLMQWVALSKACLSLSGQFRHRLLKRLCSCVRRCK